MSWYKLYTSASLDDFPFEEDLILDRSPLLWKGVFQKFSIIWEGFGDKNQILGLNKLSLKKTLVLEVI